MDLSDTIIAKSDQINADDLISGPITVTVKSVTRGAPEQPVDVSTIETPGRAYRPSKSMRRVLVAAWGKDGDAWSGRRMTLYRDPSVRFGKDEVGGIKISHLSHIDRPMSIALTVKRGQRAPHKVAPLPTDAPSAAMEPSPDDVAACTSIETLRGWWEPSGPAVRALIESRVADLQAADAAPKQL